MRILSSYKIKEWDLFTIKDEGISSSDLMERAGSNCAEQIMKDVDLNSSFHIISNKGNNGGDGLVIARKLLEDNYEVRVSVIEFSKNQSSDFVDKLQLIPDKFISYIYSIEDLEIIEDEIIVDSIFGYGLNRIVEGKFAQIIDKINTSNSLVISIDLPSGLFADDNRNNNGSIIQSSITYTFQCMKLSLLLSAYSKYCGRVKVIDIGLSNDFLKDTKDSQILLTNKSVPNIKKRDKLSHKGNYGHALLIGGNREMRGAIILSTKSALRAGIGKISVSLPKEYISEINLKIPEAMISNKLEDISKYTALGIGPGMGCGESSINQLKDILLLRGDLPLVLDADALNIISDNIELLDLCKNAIITPHIGEFKRLFGEYNSDEEKLEKQQIFANKYSITIILKGPNTSIITPTGEVFFNSTGNPGMATSGSGDVLTGIILSFLSQGYSTREASCLSVFLHSKAADLALDIESEESLIATDIIDYLGKSFDFIRDISSI